MITNKEIQDLMKPWIQEMHKSLSEKGQALALKAKQTLPAESTPAEPTDPEIQELRDKMYRHTEKFFHLLRANQFKSKSQLFEPARKADIGINRKKWLQSLDWFMDKELVQEQQIAISTTPSTFYVITDKGHDVLATPKDSKHRYNPRYFAHTLSCHLIEKYLDACGYDPKREYTPDPRIKDRIDVFCEIDTRKVAFEYINKGFQHLEATAHKCLIKMAMHELVFVMNSNPDLKTAEEIIDNSYLVKTHSDRLRKMICFKIRSEFT